MSKAKTVLVVDDNHDVVKLQKKILDSIGLNTIEMYDGKELLEYVSIPENKFDLIMLDLSMPEVNGLVALLRLQEIKHSHDFKICLVTGNADNAILNKATELNIDEVIIKPVEKAVYINKISKLLELNKVQSLNKKFYEVSFISVLIGLPVLVSFKIYGLSEEGVLIESIANFRQLSLIDFSSRDLCDAIGLDQDFTFKVVSSIQDKGIFKIKGLFLPEQTEFLLRVKDYLEKINSNTVSFD